jgi:hypothetical protein
LLQAWTKGQTPPLSLEQKSELAVFVDADAGKQANGVVRAAKGSKLYINFDNAGKKRGIDCFLTQR